jgi:hypothetical protein
LNYREIFHVGNMISKEYEIDLHSMHLHLPTFSPEAECAAKALEDLSLSGVPRCNTLSYNIMSVCKLQACNCGRRVRAGATREFSRMKFSRCSLSLSLSLPLSLSRSLSQRLRGTVRRKRHSENEVPGLAMKKREFTILLLSSRYFTTEDRGLHLM